jgi:hypothetical protein
MGWLASLTSQGRFVDNRVNHIKANVTHVRHVRSEDNPADIGSRGCSIDELIESKLWFHGPNFLLLPDSDWPEPPVKSIEFKTPSDNDNGASPIEETTNSKLTANMKVVSNAAANAKNDLNINYNIENFSNWNSLISTVAAILCFVRLICKTTTSSAILKELLQSKVKFYRHPWFAPI